MSDIINPYIAGSPVTGPEMFFGREDVFEFIRRTLIGRHRDNIIVLYGQRRTGKTSVLYQMRSHIDARYLCIFMDLHGFALESLDGFLWEFANHIVRVLRRDYQINLPRPDRTEFMLEPRHFFENEFLTQVWSNIGERHLLLMLDEAVRLQEQVQAGKLDPAIFSYLRHLMQHHERLNFLFSLGSGLEEMEKEYAFLFNVGLYKKISFLGKDAAYDLITKPVKDYYQVESTVQERIYRITSGHPYYTQLLCHGLFNYWQQKRPSRLVVEDVDEALNEAVERGSAVLKHVWEESTAAEKAVMSGMAAAMGEHNQAVDIDSINHSWEQHNVIVPAGERAKAIRSLIARDVIAGDKSYIFTIDLQRLWVQKHRRLEWVREEIADDMRAWATSSTPMIKRVEAISSRPVFRRVERIVTLVAVFLALISVIIDASVVNSMKNNTNLLTSSATATESAASLSKTATNAVTGQAACPPVGNITTQSLLVVLLDRSGSLIVQPGATDPEGYSTSVTKVLADLWPGSMAVIPFSNESTPVIGPYAMSNLQQRQILKDAVQAYPIGGNTPLDPAMQRALVLLKHAPAGSRAVIVTDGSPDPSTIFGVNQANDIRLNLLPQFCSQGTPVSAFGLALDLSQPDGQTANTLLTDIAEGTDGIQANVRNGRDLAQVVIQLYAQWQHLVFLPVQSNSGNYSISIDTYARQVDFVSFRSSESNGITIDGPDGQPVSDRSVLRSTDRNYEIDSIVPSAIHLPGTYSIKVSGDPQAQVYALVEESQLHADLLQPLSSSIAYIGQPLVIQAELIDDTSPVIPQSNEATINARVYILVNGLVTATYTVELTHISNSPLFTGNIILSGTVGQVHVQIDATYQLSPVETLVAQVTLPLERFATISSQPTPACGLNVSCYLTHYGAVVIGGQVLLVILLLLLFLLRRRKSEGWELVQGGLVVDLGTMERPLWRNLFHKSAINSQELEAYGGMDFHGERFVLLFKGNAQLVVATDEPKITVKKGGRTILITKDNRESIDLDNRDVIQVQGCKPAMLRLHEQRADDLAMDSF